MKENRFHKIIVIGSMSTAYQCAEIITQKFPNVHFYENKTDKENIPSKYLNNPLIKWHFCKNKEWLSLLKNEAEKVLLFSITNLSIIPQEIIQKDNIVLINLHSGILPQYRGRNCGGWALFNEEEYVGATWHYLTKEIDGGNILCQKKIPIAETDTSLLLLRKQYNAGIQLLQENIDKILNADVEGIPQNQEQEIYFHLSKDKPNNGMLNLDWSGKKISCFLRAMDYGPLKEFGTPTIEFDNKKAHILAYKIEKIKTPNSSKFLVEFDNKIIIEKENYKFTLNIKEY